MKKFILVGSALLISTAAFANDPIGLANNTLVLRPDHSKVPLGGHWSGNAGTANNTSVLRPDHSKVPLGGHWSGNAGTQTNTSVLRPDLPLGGYWSINAE